MAKPSVEEWMREGEKRQARWQRTGLIAGGVAVLVASGIGAYVMLNRVEAGDERVQAALRGANVRDVTLGGAASGKCEEGESSRTFSGLNAANERVTGTVCCGLSGAVKGCMIRWD